MAEYLTALGILTSVYIADYSKKKKEKTTNNKLYKDERSPLGFTKSVKDIVTKVCKDEEGILDFVEDRIKLELERNKEYRDFVIMEKNGPDHWRQLGNPDTFDNTKNEYERLEKENPGSIYSILRVENLESEVCEWIEKRDFHIEINRDYIMIGIKGKYFRIPMSEEVDLTHIILQSVKAMRGI